MDTEQLYYSKDHVWVRVEEGDEVSVGITDYAQETLGEITFIDLPKPGKRIRTHDSLAVVESVKAASDVFAPVAGTVTEVNTILAHEPKKMNQDPYGAGWICRLTGCDPGGLKKLMPAAAYQQYLAKH